jgi:hypothetical protein
MNILEHPIYKHIYELCSEIEKLPASEQQTKVVVMAGNLEIPVRELLKNRDSDLKVLKEVAENLALIEDAPGDERYGSVKTIRTLARRSLDAIQTRLLAE